jgi:hypothetical protein
MTAATTDREALLVTRHLRIGWWSLAAFLSLGIVLEALHGFKIGWYLDVSNATRRLLLTLAHVHGTLLALVHLAFAATLGLRAPRVLPRAAVASACLTGAGIALPFGFLLGGLWPWGADPGLGIVLVPVGAALLLAGVVVVALDLRTDG